MRMVVANMVGAVAMGSANAIDDLLTVIILIMIDNNSVSGHESFLSH